MKTLFCAALLAFAAAPVAAQDTPAPAPATAPAQALTPVPPPAPLPDANPALWVVRDADTTIYLFGTFHLLDGRPWFNDEVRVAFDASDELVLEAILPEDQNAVVPMLMRYALDAQHRKLSDRLSAADNAALARALAPLGAPANAFDRFEPWFVAMTLTATAAQQLGVAASNGPETILSRAARERHMPIAELEGLEWQIRLFDNMPDALQLADLHETLQEMSNTPRLLGRMLAAWSAGDADALVRISNEDSDANPELRRLVLTERNANWARWIEQRLARPGTVFIAVGAAHLAGRDSVIADLAAAHIRARRVPHLHRP
jgi:uncharacterized protein YbaP (TraB family)